MIEEKKYEEIGTTYRFFLGWRHASFAGNLVVLYGVLSLTISASKDAPELAWLIPLAASPIGVFLWWIDLRTRDLYHAAISAGVALEGGEGGFYSQLKAVAVDKERSSYSRPTQSGALNIFFLGSSLALLFIGFGLLLRTICHGA